MISQIEAYIFTALLTGYFFGWSLRTIYDEVKRMRGEQKRWERGEFNLKLVERAKGEDY